MQKEKKQKTFYKLKNSSFENQKTFHEVKKSNLENQKTNYIVKKGSLKNQKTFYKLKKRYFEEPEDISGRKKNLKKKLKKLKKIYSLKTSGFALVTKCQYFTFVPCRIRHDTKWTKKHFLTMPKFGTLIRLQILV